MPELPEVETVRWGLETHLRGARIVDVSVLRDSCVRHTPGGVEEVRSAVVGRHVQAVVRRGKFLWWLVGDDSAPTALSAHLGMSGQFRVLPVDTRPHSHCRARWVVERHGNTTAVDFVDQRTFGYLHAEDLVPTSDGLPGGQGSQHPAVPLSVAHIGRDALDPALNDDAAVAMWRTGSRGIKQVLLDQSKVSGIGNIYADEALWVAGIHPQRPANSVSRAQARDVLVAVREVMRSALAQGGTSFDALYVNVNGESGYFARDLHAYGQAGMPCERCGSAIARAKVHGRSTHWCPRCQDR